MSERTEFRLAALTRLRRYLAGISKLVCHFLQQEAVHFKVHSDTDWAGFTKTSKWTSGGCNMLIKSWSSTQGLASLLSREAEFSCVIKAAGMF